MTHLNDAEIKIMKEEIIPLISDMLNIPVDELEKDYRDELSKPNNWALDSLRYACFNRSQTKEDLLQNYRKVKVEDRKGDTIWLKVLDRPELVQKGDEGRTVLFQWLVYHIASDELYFLRGQRVDEVIQVRYHKGFQIVEVDYSLLH